MRDLSSSFEAGGTVRARTTASVASRVMAPIIDIRVRPGDRVKRGATLVTLDSREIDANRTRAVAALAAATEAARAADTETRAADAALQLANVTYQRMVDLHAKRSATQQELDQATAARDSSEAQKNGALARAAAAVAARDAAQAAVNAADVGASYGILTAPFDGVVVARAADPGSMATPGSPLLTLEDTTFRLEASVDEARAGQLSVGQTIEVMVGGASAWTPAHIVEIARIDSASRAFVIKVELPGGPELRSGMFGRIRLTGPVRRTLTVPAAALVRRGQLTYVFVVDAQGIARLRSVSPGQSTVERVELLAGVRDGEAVAINPHPALIDGARTTTRTGR
jgi:RND family efflux transporter MFP subunit